MRTTIISFAGTTKELREQLEQLQILFPNQKMEEIYKVTGLLKDSNIEEEEFIQAPAKKMKVTAKKVVVKCECNVCGEVWGRSPKHTDIDNFICPTCHESLLYNVKATTLIDIIQEKFWYGLHDIKDEEKSNLVMELESVRANFKALLEKY